MPSRGVVASTVGPSGVISKPPSYLRVTTPKNLDLALEGLVRKVLKDQPKQDEIYKFAAEYFEELVEIRDRSDAFSDAGEICPNRTEQEAAGLIKLATSFPKPHFLLSPSRTVPYGEELCRVVDVDQIPKGEEADDVAEAKQEEGIEDQESEAAESSEAVETGGEQAVSEVLCANEDHKSKEDIDDGKEEVATEDYALSSADAADEGGEKEETAVRAEEDTQKEDTVIEGQKEDVTVEVEEKEDEATKEDEETVEIGEEDKERIAESNNEKEAGSEKEQDTSEQVSKVDENKHSEEIEGNAEVGEEPDTTNKHSEEIEGNAEVGEEPDTTDNKEIPDDGRTETNAEALEVKEKKISGADNEGDKSQEEKQATSEVKDESELLKNEDTQEVEDCNIGGTNKDETDSLVQKEDSRCSPADDEFPGDGEKGVTEEVRSGTVPDENHSDVPVEEEAGTGKKDVDSSSTEKKTSDFIDSEKAETSYETQNSGQKESASKTFIESEQGEEMAAGDPERDVIREFLEKEQEYNSMGNCTRSKEIAEVYVNDGVSLKSVEVVGTTDEPVAETGDGEAELMAMGGAVAHKRGKRSIDVEETAQESGVGKENEQDDENLGESPVPKTEERSEPAQEPETVDEGKLPDNNNEESNEHDVGEVVQESEKDLENKEQLGDAQNDENKLQENVPGNIGDIVEGVHETSELETVPENVQEDNVSTSEQQGSEEIDESTVEKDAAGAENSIAENGVELEQTASNLMDEEQKTTNDEDRVTAEEEKTTVESDGNTESDSVKDGSEDEKENKDEVETENSAEESESKKENGSDADIDNDAAIESVAQGDDKASEVNAPELGAEVINVSPTIQHDSNVTTATDDPVPTENDIKTDFEENTGVEEKEDGLNVQGSGETGEKNEVVEDLKEAENIGVEKTEEKCENSVEKDEMLDDNEEKIIENDEKEMVNTECPAIAEEDTGPECVAEKEEDRSPKVDDGGENGVEGAPLEVVDGNEKDTEETSGSENNAENNLQSEVTKEEVEDVEPSNQEQSLEEKSEMLFGEIVEDGNATGRTVNEENPHVELENQTNDEHDPSDSEVTSSEHGEKTSEKSITETELEQKLDTVSEESEATVGLEPNKTSVYETNKSEIEEAAVRSTSAKLQTEISLGQEGETEDNDKNVRSTSANLQTEISLGQEGETANPDDQDQNESGNQEAEIPNSELLRESSTGQDNEAVNQETQNKSENEEVEILNSEQQRESSTGQDDEAVDGETQNKPENEETELRNSELQREISVGEGNEAMNPENQDQNKLENDEITNSKQETPVGLEEDTEDLDTNKSELEETEIRSRSSRDEESLLDENPFISAEVTTLVQAQEESSEPEVEDSDDVIVPLNAEIGTIAEGGEGGLARQAMVLRAAITIQRNFRKYLRKKKVEETSIETYEQKTEVSNFLTTVEEEKSLESISTSSSVSSTASKIPRRIDLYRRNTFSESIPRLSFSETEPSTGDEMSTIRARSMSTAQQAIPDSEVWKTLEREMQSDATLRTSQANFKENRQRLRREDAIQITTTASEESSANESPKKPSRLLGTGELHDTIVPEE